MLKKLLARLRRNDSPSAANSQRGGFAGAKRDRTTEEWWPANLHPNAVHRIDNIGLLARVRDLVNNNTHAASAVLQVVTNVIERGITPRPRGEMFIDSAASERESRGTSAQERRRLAWIRHWNQWGGEFECESDITGQQTIYDQQSLWLEELMVGGGVLAHYHVMPTSQNLSRRLPLTIQLYPEERFIDDRDDFAQWTNNRKSSNQIVRGVEIDSATGRPVRYWLKPEDRHGSTGQGAVGDPESLDAEHCRYTFRRRRVGQYRGFSMLAPAVIMLWRLGFFTDSTMIASGIKSQFGVIIKSDTVDFDGLDDDAAAVDQHGNVIEKLEGGIIARIRSTDDVTGISPTLPQVDEIGWLKFIERSIFMSLGLSRSSGTRDHSDENFGSIRASRGDDQKLYRVLQQMTIRHFCRPTWKRFCTWAARRGLDQFPPLTEFAANMDQWVDCEWGTPGWQSVNPFDDARAAAINQNYNRLNPFRSIAESGDDPVDTLYALDDWYGLIQSLPNLRRAQERDTANSTTVRRSAAQSETERGDGDTMREKD